MFTDLVYLLSMRVYYKKNGPSFRPVSYSITTALRTNFPVTVIHRGGKALFGG